MMQPDSFAQEGQPAVVRFLAELEQRVSSKDFRHWFHRKLVIRVVGELLSVGVGSPFLVNWMQSRFRAEFAAAAQCVLGPSAIVRFDVVTAKPQETPPQTSAPSAQRDPAAGTRDDPPPPAESVAGPAPAPPSQAPNGRRRFSTLNDFVAVSANQLPLLAAFNVARSPGVQYNPLCLYGPHGCGKTHLLEGIYCEVRRQHPTLRTVYLTAENFTNYFTQALRNHKLPGFREKFRTLDVLLVDDVHFFERKKATQEEFLHTFDQLTSHGKQIIISADRHPRVLGDCFPVLATRYISGLTCRVDAPAAEDRLELLRHRCRRINIAVKPAALEYLAQRFTRDVRELIGALNCLAPQYELTGKPVGVTHARRFLVDQERIARQMIGIADIERAVCEFFRVQPAELKSERRTQSIAQPRMLAMFLARKHTAAGYTEIGRHFGGRNHATVINAEKRVGQWLEAERTIQVANECWPLSDVIAAIERSLAG